jgi:hypothetical protein
VETPSSGRHLKVGQLFCASTVGGMRLHESRPSSARRRSSARRCRSLEVRFEFLGVVKLHIVGSSGYVLAVLALCVAACVILALTGHL